MAQEIADSKLLDTWSSSGTKIEPDITKIIEGWQLGEQPPHEYMNWLQNTFGSKLNHILKNGVAEWNSETEYLVGSSVQHNGSIWICQNANANSEPTGLNANWEKVAISKDLTVTVDTLADLRSISYPANTVWASGYHTKNDSAFGSNIFRLKGVKTTETDNGGTVIIATIGGVDYVYELQYDGAVNVKWFGAIGNGITDDIIPINNALVAAEGRTIFAPKGVYRITSSLNSSGELIKIIGETQAYITHTLISDSYSNVYEEDIPSRISGVTIFKCDGCNFIGNPDTTTTCNYDNKIRLIENLLVWGLNGAKQGIHYRPQDTIIRNSTFALFEEFGILQRAGITSRIENCAFVDNGWNMANSGTATYPNTYTSGCAIKLVSNITANDYTTVVPTTRVTTTTIDNCFTWDRDYTVNNKSGLRALQAGGALGLEINALQSYVGCFFDTCSVNIDGYYFENYTSGGFVSGDGFPYGMYFINSQPNIGQGHIQVSGGGLTAVQEPIKIVTTEPSWLSTPYAGINNHNGVDKSIGTKSSRMTKEVTISTPGASQVYAFKNVINTGSASITADDRGFLGMVPISLTRKANLANQSKGIWLMGRNRLSSDLPVTTLVFANAGAGAYDVNIVPSFSGNDLNITVTWGSSWGAGDTWILDVGMIGCDVFAS